MKIILNLSLVCLFLIQIWGCHKKEERHVSIPPGYTVLEVAKKIDSIKCLKGKIKSIPKEGYALPGKYVYQCGTYKQTLIDEMKKNMATFLSKAWGNRSNDLPLYNSEEALILASIVEKEAGKRADKKRIAGVFINRLRNGMKLQSDPTVMYGITNGLHPFNRKITKEDLVNNNAFNTYVIDRLPKHPICCPSLASIQAVLHPIETEDLYFVADGKGDLNYSKTYDEHMQNVAKWRKIEKTLKSIKK
ncbi:MAG: hypothetical protein BGO10_02320 [Chlamydia sp. 32-24]|nr:MAG: hypothetical protein BGO10_02320 [Chlamydia sp. 32-24]